MSNTITINYREESNLDAEGEELLKWTLVRALRHVHKDGSSAFINCSNRKKTGWLEFILVVTYAGGGKLYIGCIQRQLGADFESHS